MINIYFFVVNNIWIIEVHSKKFVDYTFIEYMSSIMTSSVNFFLVGYGEQIKNVLKIIREYFSQLTFFPYYHVFFIVFTYIIRSK